jgi:DNA-binding beta-propeller fold protein YncE
MKNKYTIIIFALLSLLMLFSCTNDIEKIYPEFSTYLDYNFKLEKTIDIATVKTNTFNPKGVFLDNGKIYITNYSENRLEIVDAKTGTVLKYIKQWNFNGATETLDHPTDVCVSNGRIYVTNLWSYRVDVFDAKTLAFISCIGVGNYWGDNSILDPWTVKVSGKKVFVKTREAYIAVYNTDDITPANYKKVKAKAFLTLQNEGFDNNSYSMECSNNKLYLTDRNSKKIFVFDIDKIDFNNSALADKSKAIAPSSSIILKDMTAVPSGLSIYKDSLMFVSYNNLPRIDIMKKDDNNVISSFQDLGGVQFGKPEKIFIKNDTLLISDSNKNIVNIATIKQSKIKEYK